MKHINSEQLSMVAAMIFGYVPAGGNDRVVKAVQTARQLLIESSKVAEEHNQRFARAEDVLDPGR